MASRSFDISRWLVSQLALGLVNTRLVDNGAEMNKPEIGYKNHRFPPRIIARAAGYFFGSG